ncbi:MAG TPA: SDR family NAD(P)-dependent oxidoreductase, partial [Thermoanaerobaculia bacterium]
MRRNGDLSGRVAFVTGGASGIGLACARELARQGALVSIADADAARLRRLSREFGAGNLHALDVADAAAVRAAVGKVVSNRGRLDVLVLAAGICRDAVLWKMTDDA